jgi:hypothetical protein
MLAHFGQVGLAGTLALSGAIDVDSAIVTLGGLPACPPARQRARRAHGVADPAGAGRPQYGLHDCDRAWRRGLVEGRGAVTALAPGALVRVVLMPLVAWM